MTNEEILENGRNLFQSAENLRQSAPDLDALMASLSDLLSKETFAGGKAKYASREDDSSGNDWIATTYTGNFEVRGQGRGAPRIGTITYVVRLCGNDAPSSQDPTWPWLDQACLFVGWHRNHDYWGPEDFEPSEARNLHHRKHGLWAYCHPEENEDSAYFFAVPIFALQNEKDLRCVVVDPLTTLFQNDSPADADGCALHDCALKPSPE